MTSAGLPKVLVVDDEGDIRELLRATLARAGCALLFAGSGQEALAVARRELPAVILLCWLAVHLRVQLKCIRWLPKTLPK